MRGREPRGTWRTRPTVGRPGGPSSSSPLWAASAAIRAHTSCTVLAPPTRHRRYRSRPVGDGRAAADTLTAIASKLGRRAATGSKTRLLSPGHQQSSWASRPARKRSFRSTISFRAWNRQSARRFFCRYPTGTPRGNRLQYGRTPFPCPLRSRREPGVEELQCLNGNTSRST
jgi:hypothetical protein